MRFCRETSIRSVACSCQQEDATRSVLTQAASLLCMRFRRKGVVTLPFCNKGVGKLDLRGYQTEVFTNMYAQNAEERSGHETDTDQTTPIMSGEGDQRSQASQSLTLKGNTSEAPSLGTPSSATPSPKTSDSRKRKRITLVLNRQPLTTKKHQSATQDKDRRGSDAKPMKNQSNETSDAQDKEEIYPIYHKGVPVQEFRRPD